MSRRVRFSPGRPWTHTGAITAATGWDVAKVRAVLERLAQVGLAERGMRADGTPTWRCVSRRAS